MSQGAYEQTCSVDRQTRGLWVNPNVGVRLFRVGQARSASAGGLQDLSYEIARREGLLNSKSERSTPLCKLEMQG